MTEVLWGKTVLRAYKFIPNAASKLDELIVFSALDSSGLKGSNPSLKTTYEQVDYVISLVRKKENLMMTSSMVDEALNMMNYESQLLLKMIYTKGLRFDHVQNVFGYSKRTFFRRASTALKEFCQMLERCGATNEWLDAHLLDQKWINRIKQKCDKVQKDCDEDIEDERFDAACAV